MTIPTNLLPLVGILVAVGVGVLITTGLLDRELGDQFIDLILVGLGGAGGYAARSAAAKPPGLMD